MSCERPKEEILRDLAAVKRMIGRGVLSMAYDGRSVTYRTMDEMIRARTNLEKELAEVDGDTAPGFRRYSFFEKGY